MSKNVDTVLFYFLFFFFFLIACTDHRPAQPPDVSGLGRDSTRIVQYIDSALKIPNRADSFLQLSQQLITDRPELEDTYNLSYGRYLILSGELDQARDHVQQVIDGFGTDTLSYGLAKYHNLLAAVAGYGKEQEESVSQFQQAIKIYELYGDDRQASVIKFNLANIFFARLDYESAYKYSSEALGALEVAKDTAMLTLCMSISSIATANLKKLDIATRYATEALKLAEQHPNLQGELFANYAMGEVELTKGEYQTALDRLQQAIHLGEEHGMLQWLIPVRASLLRAYVGAKDFRSAISAGEKLLEQAKTFNNRDILYSAYKHLSTAFEQTGQYQRAYTYLKDGDELLREQISEANERAIHDMLVKYEAEQKKNTILRQENELAGQRMWGVIISVVALTAIFGLLWIWRSSQQKNRLQAKEKENAVFHALNTGEEQERKRLASELHDGIASNLVAIKLQLENRENDSSENSPILELVEKTHGEIRKIAHNLSPIDFDNTSLPQAIDSFTQECSSENCEVLFYTNIGEQTGHFQKDRALIIYRTIQELTQNALKHAEASTVNVQLLQKAKEYLLTIEDDGKGFDATSGLPTQSGLHKLFGRLKKINAEVDLESRPGSGTAIFIRLNT